MRAISGVVVCGLFLLTLHGCGGDERASSRTPSIGGGGAAGAGGSAGSGGSSGGDGAPGGDGGGEWSWGETDLPPAVPDAPWTQLVPLDQLPDPGAWAISLTPEGELWIGTHHGLVWRRPDGSLRIFTVADGLASDQIAAVEGRALGEVFVGYGYQGHDLGWLRVDGDGPPTVSHHVIATREMGEAIHEVFRIVADRRPGRTDHVWLATNEVLALFLGSDPVLQHRHPRHPHGSAWGLALAPDGAVWEGDAWQVARLGYEETNNFFTARWSRTRIPWPGGSDILDIALETDSVVWAASLGKGLARYDSAANEVRHYAPPMIPDLALRAVAVAPDGAVWVGSQERGIAVIRGEQVQFHNSSGTLRANSIRAIEIGEDGTVVVATERGVWSLAP